MTLLAQISDLHFGAEDSALVAALETALHDLSPDLVAVSGDLTQRGGRREFEAAAAFLSRLPFPKLVAPGNHDTPLLNLFARFADPFARHHRRMGAGALHRFCKDKVAARMLNTARGVQLRHDWSLGVVRLADAQAVADDLAAAPAQCARVVVCHHPLVTPAASPLARAGARGGLRAADVLAQAGVDLVLTGHLHVEFADPLPVGDGMTWAVGSGTALSRRLRGKPAGFNTLRVADDHIALDIWHSTGAAFAVAERRILPRRPRA